MVRGIKHHLFGAGDVKKIFNITKNMEPNSKKERTVKVIFFNKTLGFKEFSCHVIDGIKDEYDRRADMDKYIRNWFRISQYETVNIISAKYDD